MTRLAVFYVSLNQKVSLSHFFLITAGAREQSEYTNLPKAPKLGPSRQISLAKANPMAKPKGQGQQEYSTTMSHGKCAGKVRA